MSLESIELYLPKYLSEGSVDALKSAVEQFRKTRITRSLFTQALKGEAGLFQGDGVGDLPVVRLPDARIETAPCLVLSNTCDISLDNERPYEANIVYAPLMDLARYRSSLARRGVTGDRLEGHLQAIRQQAITSIFYLPAEGPLADEKFVPLDSVLHIPLRRFDFDALHENRLFTLSDFGLWLLVLKLAVHFSRLHERVDRRVGGVL